MAKTIRFPCPHCKKQLLVSAGIAGQRVRCPNPACREVIAIPELATADPRPPTPSPPAEPKHAMPAGAAATVRKLRWRIGLSVAVVVLVGAGFVVGFVVFDRAHLTGGLLAGGGVLGIGLLVPLGLWIELRRVTGWLDQFRRGEYITHWTYTPDEWQAFDPNWKPGEPVGETYIGKYAGLCGETFVEWNVFGQVIEDAAVDDGPPAVLKIVIRVQNVNTGPYLQLFRVPIPAGRAAEAQHVVRTLRHVQKQSGCFRLVALVVSVVLFLGWLLLCILTVFVK